MTFRKSPLSRHEVQSQWHFFIYLIHDISSVSFLVLLILSFFQTYLHTMMFMVSISLASGWALILFRQKSREDIGHLTKKEVATTCLVNQGFAVMMLAVVYFYPQQMNLNILKLCCIAISLHALYCSLKCYRLFLSDSKKNDRFSETTIQLIYTIAVPNFLVFLYFVVHTESLIKNEVVFLWLFFECMPGLLFSIAHDRFWIWGKNGLPVSIRHGVCLLPYLWLGSFYLWAPATQ